MLVFFELESSGLHTIDATQLTMLLRLEELAFLVGYFTEPEQELSLKDKQSVMSLASTK